MKIIKLPNQPKGLPPTAEVRDFDLGKNKFCRVIMSLSPSAVNDHFVMSAQAYEMDKKGQFVAAPLAYPSRTTSSQHTVPVSGLGDTIEMDDDWVRATVNFDPSNPGDVEISKAGKPAKAGTVYGQMIWSNKEQKMYRWAEGFADGVARGKAEEMLAIFSTSEIRSGMAFRRKE